MQKQKDLLDENPTDRTLKKSYETAKKELHRETSSESRLFAIDASLDYETLSRQYRDSNIYLIVKGIIKLYNNEIERGVYGHLQELSIRSIHIPLEHRKILNGLDHERKAAPRYKAVVHYGQRYEPWIVSVEVLESSK